MPRPEAIPDWMYPGTEVRDEQNRSWTIQSIEYREGSDHSWDYYCFLRAREGTSVEGFSVNWVIAHYDAIPFPHAVPTILPAELREYVYRGLINVMAYEPDMVLVTSATNATIDLHGVSIPSGQQAIIRSPGWEGISLHLGGENTMMVAFDGAQPMPFRVVEIDIGQTTRYVLETIPTGGLTTVPLTGFDVTAPITADAFYDQQGVVQYVQRVAPSTSVTLDMGAVNETLGMVNQLLNGALATLTSIGRALVQKQLEASAAAPEPPTRRLSHWERLAEMKRGPDAIPGGAGTHQGLGMDTTPDDEAGVQ